MGLLPLWRRYLVMETDGVFPFLRFFLSEGVGEECTSKNRVESTVVVVVVGLGAPFAKIEPEEEDIIDITGRRGGTFPISTFAITIRAMTDVYSKGLIARHMVSLEFSLFL